MLRHPRTGDLLTPLGWRKDGRPIWPILGAAPDDSDDADVGDDADDAGGDDTDDDDDSDDTDDKDDEDEPLGPAGKKALAAERAEVARLKRENRQLRRSGQGKDGDDGKDTDEKVTAARTEEAEKWKPLLVRQAATAALSSAGLIGKPDRLLRLLDLSDIDVDPETGDIDGLDDQIKDFRREYRELFRKRGSSSIDAADRDGGDDDGKPKSATQRQADLLLGRTGRR